jgi:hypothetical protein
MYPSTEVVKSRLSSRFTDLEIHNTNKICWDSRFFAGHGLFPRQGAVIEKERTRQRLVEEGGFYLTSKRQRLETLFYF